MRGNSRITYPAHGDFHDKSEISRKYQHPIGFEWSQNPSFASVFQKKNGGGGPPRERKKNLRHHVYQSFESKNYTHGEGGSTCNRQKLVKNAPFASVFKNFLGEAPPPPPLLQEDKKLPSLALCDPLQLRWKFSCITYIEDRSFWRQKLHTIFGEKINTNSA